MDAPRPWYDAAFEEGYLDVYPHRDAAAARAEVAALVERGLGGRVLDLGCGFGRHLSALRERGVDAWGLDRSLGLLRRAPAELRGRLARGDFRALPYRDGAFDGVAMLFSSFGYFEDAENELVARELARVLAPGGVALLDVMNPARVRATLVPESRARRAGLAIEERRALARDGTRVRKEVRVVAADGAERGWTEDVRLYESAELDALLARAGLRTERREGDFDGRAFGADAPRQIVWARATRRA